MLIALAKSFFSTVDARNSLHGVAPFRDGRRGVSDGRVEALFRVRRALRQQVRHRLEAQEQPMEALQQRIVELTRDARAFSDPCVERQRKRVSQLARPIPVSRPQKRHEGSPATARNQAV